MNVNTITTATTNPAGAVAGSGSGTAAATGARAAPGAGGAPSANPGAAGAGGPPAAPFKKPEVDNINRIYVGSLHYDLKDVRTAHRVYMGGDGVPSRCRAFSSPEYQP